MRPPQASTSTGRFLAFGMLAFAGLVLGGVIGPAFGPGSAGARWAVLLGLACVVPFAWFGIGFVRTAARRRRDRGDRA